jgi:hydrogenase maturation factor
MVAVVPPEAADDAMAALAGVGVQARRIGEVVTGTGLVRFAD